MPEFIQDEVRALMDDPDAEGSVTLLVGLTASSERPSVRAQLRDAGAQEIEYLPFQTYKVSIDATNVAALPDIPGIESIEFDRDVQVANSGN